MSYTVEQKTSNFTIDLQTSVYVYFLDATNNNITVSLPEINYSDGLPFLFVRTDNSNYTVTISAYTGEYIDGNTTKTMSVGASYELISFNNNWISHA